MKKLGRWSSPGWVVSSGQESREAFIWEVSYMSGSLLNSSGEGYETCNPHPGGDGGI